MKLDVGDLVVYGTHGIGRVAATGELVVIELEDGLRVTVPVIRAREILRPLATKEDLTRVRETLQGDPELSAGPWLGRRRETLEKLAGGSPVQLAEIVSEGAQRERLRAASGSKAQLSSGEKEIFVRARKLLAEEIAVALDLQPAGAEGWIDEQLARPSD